MRSESSCGVGHSHTFPPGACSDEFASSKTLRAHFVEDLVKLKRGLESIETALFPPRALMSGGYCIWLNAPHHTRTARHELSFQDHLAGRRVRLLDALQQQFHFQYPHRIDLAWNRFQVTHQTVAYFLRFHYTARSGASTRLSESPNIVCVLTVSLARDLDPQEPLAKTLLVGQPRLHFK
jgi:hypothetical protein